LSFCVKKTNHSTYLTAGGSGDGSVHVSSVITPRLCFAGSTDMWSTSVGGHLMKVVKLTGFTVSLFFKTLGQLTY
jgi:hypothetical protein